jgi:hypothetical protein
MTVSDVSTLVRYLVMDFAQVLSPGDLFTYGSSNVFALSQTNIISITGVLINGVGGQQYVYDTDTKKVTIPVPMSVGDTVEIQYRYYPNYSDSELESYVRAAMIFLSVNNYYTFTIDEASDTISPDPDDREQNLIAFVASILIKPDNQTIRLPDMTINVPVGLPTRDIITKAVMIFKHNNTGVFDIAGDSSVFIPQ